MQGGTGKINVPLGRYPIQEHIAKLAARSYVFLKGPLTVTPKLQVDFPLDGEYYFDIIPADCTVGLTVGELIDRVIEIYKLIYSGIDQQDFTPHDYGIYSHDLDELVLVEAEYSPKDCTIYLAVEAV